MAYNYDGGPALAHPHAHLGAASAASSGPRLGADRLYPTSKHHHRPQSAAVPGAPLAGMNAAVRAQQALGLAGSHNNQVPNYNNPAPVASVVSAVPGMKRQRAVSQHATKHPLVAPSVEPTPAAAGQNQNQNQNKDKNQQGGGGKLTKELDLPPLMVRRPEGSGGPLQRGKLLGEGGFARVYEAFEPDGTKKAIKVIAKSQLKTQKTKTKLFAEIKLHQTMGHANIVGFEGCFEDDQNVYMQLELCPYGSMLDLLRARKRYSEPEARFYLLQLVAACDYMHSHSVIHRDLKLGNLFLDKGMNLRVGDFGLAALVKFPGERKKTICGTPNYIAPEILFDQSTGHSFEVDIWSIGVILYTMLVGRPPFQMKEVKQIYHRIKETQYTFPDGCHVSDEAQDLISAILSREPDSRPSLPEIMSHPFFFCGPFPLTVPSLALQAQPDFSTITAHQSSKNFTKAKKICWAGAEMGYGVEREAQEVFIAKEKLGAVKEDATEAAASAAVVEEGAKARVAAAMAEEKRKAQKAAEAERMERLMKPKRVENGKPVIGSNNVPGGFRTEMVEDVGPEQRVMETEVKKVLDPGSPIADLLRTAQQPLMVSPHREPKENLQRKASTRAQAQQDELREKENQQPLPRAGRTAVAFPRHRKASSKSSNPDAAAAAAAADSEAPKLANVAASLGRSASTKQQLKAGRANVDPPPPAERPRSISTAGQSTNGKAPLRAQRTKSSTVGPPSTGGTALSIPTKGSDGPWTGESGTEVGRAALSAKQFYEHCCANLDMAMGITSVKETVNIPEPEEIGSPRVFINAWVDYTHKYGTAYFLTDGSAGLYFNDSTSMIFSPNRTAFDYIHNRKGAIYSRRNYDIKDPPTELARKAYLLNYFEDYMSKALTRDVPWAFMDEERSRNMDFLVKYYRTKSAIVFKLSNDVIQFNFFDHTKILLTENATVISVIDEDRRLLTYSLRKIARNMVKKVDGNEDAVARHKARIEFLRVKLTYCRDILRGMADNKKGGDKGIQEVNPMAETIL